MAILAPSILSADFYSLGREIEEAVECGADWLHIDIMDFHFAPQLTFGSKIIADIKKYNPVFCDVHLMVTNPADHIEPVINAGADLINFHAEAAIHGDRIINQIKKHRKKTGITINPTTPVSALEHYLPLVDLVLIMSINPGFSGQKILQYTFSKIEQLKELREKQNYHYQIQIDGGINLNNIEQILGLGTDVIVSGSSFFQADKEKKKKMADIIHQFNSD